MVRVPVPVDGLVRLRAEAIALYPLDTLFKTRVDVDDAPGQLNDVTVQLVPAGLRVTATVEDAETGATQDFEATLAVEIGDGAPDAGGPVPPPPDEDALDWDDEQPFGEDDDLDEDFEPDDLSDEAPETPRRPETRGAAPKDDGGGVKLGNKGLEALLRALMSGGPDERASAPAPATAVADDDDEPDELPDDEDSDEAPVSAVPNGLLSEEEEARSLVQLLVDQEQLELTGGAKVSALASGVARILARRVDSETKATALSEWLIEQPQVEELFIDDEALAQLLEEW